MNTLFFRIYLCAVCVHHAAFFTQEYPGGLSDGTLDINGNNVPVKIYSTTEMGDLTAFPDRESDKNQSFVVILNESNFEPSYYNYGASTLAKYKRIQSTSFSIKTLN